MRKYTDKERRELDSLCYESKRGRGKTSTAARALALYKISPDEYGAIQREAAMRAVEEVARFK